MKHVTVIGAGTMGHGIAQVAAQAGYETILCDINEEVLEKGRKQIKAHLAKAVEKGKLSEEDALHAESCLETRSNLAEAVAHADLVIEAVPEKLELKQSIFKELSAQVSDNCILATNTSSLSISKIAEAASHPERVVGMHFFNPPYIIKFLEIVRARQTSDETVTRVQEAGEKMNRDMIVVNDAPGFASSRLGLALGLEAIRMLESGVASAQDIDKAMEYGYKHPMGPLKLTDLVGLDVRLGIAQYLHKELGSEAFTPPALLQQMVADGKLGKKSGLGFYTW